MLAIEKPHWYSWDFTVSQAGRRIAEIGLSWRERGRLTVNGLAYAVRRERAFGEFRLEAAGNTVAIAVKPSLFRRVFQVTHGAKTWTVRRESLWSRRIQVLEGDREIGHITRRSRWSYRSDAVLPDTMPMPVQVFCVWLAALIWKREADATAGAGAG
jgi:hypothetical protein